MIRNSAVWLSSSRRSCSPAATTATTTLLQGWVEAELVFVSPDEQGRVETLKVREGDRVRKRRPAVHGRRRSAEADLVVRNAAGENAQAELSIRAKELLKRRTAGTQKAYDDAQAALRQAKANLEWAQTRLARRDAHSPGDGTIEQIYYRPGEIGSGLTAGRGLAAARQSEGPIFCAAAVLPELKYGDVVDVL